ncbi:MAG: hypothetical protein HOH58_03355, partial [Opitutaceae bacterium]|nr:hypothetical protein [Opitutaceae bacterium]
AFDEIARLKQSVSSLQEARDGSRRRVQREGQGQDAREVHIYTRSMQVADPAAPMRGRRQAQDGIGGCWTADGLADVIDVEGRTAEVNAACDDGKLDAVGPRSGFVPRWHPDYAKGMRNEWRRYLGEAMNLERFETIVPGSTGSDDEIRPFVDLSYDNLSPAPRATYFHKPDQIELNRLKIDRLRFWGDALRGKFEVLFWLAIGLLIARALEASVRRTWTWGLWLAVAVLAAAVAELLINFLVHTMAFENLYPAAFAPAYPLFQVVVILVFVDVTRTWLRPLAPLLWKRFKPQAKPAV